MKLKFIIAMLFMFPLAILAQQVTIEDKPLTAEQKRVQKVREEIRKMEVDYDKAKQQHAKNTQNLFPNSFSLNADKKALIQKKKDIQAVLYSIQERGLKEKAREIDALKKSIGDKASYSEGLQNRINKLDENLIRINNHLNGVQKKEGEDKTTKIIQETNLSKLDKEISSLDAMLANSKAPTTKKVKSLDDFLSEKGKTPNSKTNSGNNLDAMLSSSNNKKTTKSNSLDDMLSSSSKNSKSNSLDNLISEASDDTDFKIDSKNGLTGVINSSGKVLISYKDWKIIEYKMGIAKVKKNIETTNCNGTYTAYKEGFVDNKGEFIDGFNIDFESYKNSSLPQIYLTVTERFQNNPNLSWEENQRRYKAFDREQELSKLRRERKKEIEERQKEIERKKCEIEINNWKSSIIAKYQ